MEKSDLIKEFTRIAVTVDLMWNIFLAFIGGVVAAIGTLGGYVVRRDKQHAKEIKDANDKFDEFEKEIREKLESNNDGLINFFGKDFEKTGCEINKLKADKVSKELCEERHNRRRKKK